jgi:transposase-like protein
MARRPAPFTPPHCPRPTCPFHENPQGWRYIKKGFFSRQASPKKIQRYNCRTCGHSFSSQSFHPTYWLKRPDLQKPLFYRVLGCSAFRQIARELDVAPSTVQRQTARLGRHCLLFHEQLRPKGPLEEALVVDGFESFEYSQYTPVHFHLAVGSRSHFWHAFTDSELRRKGRMTRYQKKRRAELEQRYGRPDPKSIEREMAALVELVVPEGQAAEIHSDDHPAYPRAFRRCGREVVQRVTSSKARRTTRNPLYPVNLLDLLIRHGSANHKRETIAYSKRRQAAAERLAILMVWRNCMKFFSEKKKNQTPAQRLRLVSRRLGVDDVLGERLFPSRIELPARLAVYYRRETVTRRLPSGTRHRLKLAD